MNTATTSHRTNGLENPLGLDDPSPQLSWSAPAATLEGAFELEVATEPTFDGDAIVWRSIDVVNPEFGVRYEGRTLRSRSRYWWRVREVSNDIPHAWSEAAWFETGLLRSSDWSAQWITSPAVVKGDVRTLYFKGPSIEAASPVVRARVYASALGWYRLFVNGVDLTGHALVPRWTSFDKEIEYQVYDATAAVQVGAISLAMVVAEGRYRGRIGGAYRSRVYGDHLGVLAQLELDLADGSTVIAGTDGAWSVGTGRILTSDPMSGERVDLRIADDQWLQPDGRPQDDHPAVIHPHPPGRLIAEEVPRVAAFTELPGTVTRTPSGAQLIDFGQCFAGVARVRLQGASGDTVKLSYSEVLTPEGELDTTYIGSNPRRKSSDWFQRDEVILSDRAEVYTPWFTIHGFRYVAVEGLEAELASDDVAGIVLTTLTPSISEFHASDPRLEQLWRNVRWSLRSNFTDTATDCPSRERSGWTGDIQVFAPTAVQLVESGPFLRRYLRNLAMDQNSDGTVPPFIPRESAPGRGGSGLDFARTSVGWGDATAIIPWVMYQYLGDRTILERQYDSAVAWVDNMARRAATSRRINRRVGKRLGRKQERFILDRGYNWGEWLRPGEKFAGMVIANILGQPVVATAYLAHTSNLMSEIADTLGRSEDATRFSKLSHDVAEAWRAAFVRDGGSRIGEDKQDEYVRALSFNLLLPEQREPARQRLFELIEQAGGHLGTGFLSTPMILSTLVEEGRSDLAFDLLLQDTSPSWLSQISQGATTIWENWQGYKPDGHAEASHNHYALGAVAAFLQERVAGLSPIQPGYRSMRIAPILDARLTGAGVRLETPFGRASSVWERDGGRVVLRIEVPRGTTAVVELGELHQLVGPGSHTFETLSQFSEMS